MSTLTNIDQLFAKAAAAAVPFDPPTGTRAEQGREILRRCEAREETLCQQALEAEREGDHEGTWMAMALRAENNRFIARLKADLATEG